MGWVRQANGDAVTDENASRNVAGFSGIALVSIVIPCYNDGEYLAQSVASAQAQTYPEIEIVIVDDGSDDPATREALARLPIGERLTLLRANRAGPAMARNMGIARARGKYILPLDADDRIAPSYVEKAVSLMQSDPAIGAVYCKAEYFGEKSGPWELPEFSIGAMLVENIVFATALFEKADWERAGGYKPEYAGMEDYDLWLSFLERGRQIRRIPETLFSYRIKPASRTTRFMEDRERVRNTFQALYENHKPLYERYRDEYVSALRDAWITLHYERRELYAEMEAVKRSYGAIDAILKRTPPFLKRFFRRLSRGRARGGDAR